jgi:hypothetical protein
MRHELSIKLFVLSLSKHEWLNSLRQAQAERNVISISSGSIVAAVSVAFTTTDAPNISLNKSTCCMQAFFQAALKVLIPHSF